VGGKGVRALYPSPLSLSDILLLTPSPAIF
jgi:hypothetical protein